MGNENNQLVSSRKIGMRDVKAAWAPRMKTLRANEGRSGFTLLELLVVILIIAILAAIAVPQYQKAVWKSRSAGLKQMLATVVLAEDAYYLTHGQYAPNFSDMDINLPLSAPKTNGTSQKHGLSGALNMATMGPNAVLRGENFEIVLNTTSLSGMAISAYWTEGPYKFAGFIILSYDIPGGLSRHVRYCRVWSASAEEFCTKIEGAKPTQVSTYYL